MFGPNVGKIRSTLVRAINGGEVAYDTAAKTAKLNIRSITDGVIADLAKEQLTDKVMLDISKKEDRVAELLDHPEVSSLSLYDQFNYLNLIFKKSKEMNNPGVLTLKYRSGYKIVVVLSRLCDKTMSEKDWSNEYNFGRRMVTICLNDLDKNVLFIYLSLYHMGNAYYQQKKYVEAKVEWNDAMTYYSAVINDIKDQPERINRINGYQNDIKTKMQTFKV
jgi:hypothetical protein